MERGGSGGGWNVMGRLGVNGNESQCLVHVLDRKHYKYSIMSLDKT